MKNIPLVTSDPLWFAFGGGIWRIKANSDGSSGTKTLVTNANTHLEGVITLPNDSVKYGPWAGKMLVGAEVAHKIFIVDPSGNVTSTNFNVGSTNIGGQTFQRFLDPEDFDIIPADQDLYIVDTDPQLGHALAKYPRTLFTNFVGDLLVVQAGELVNNDAGNPNFDDKRFYVIHWDGTEFLIRNIFYTPGLLNPSVPLEHATFAPIDLP